MATPWQRYINMLPIQSFHCYYILLCSPSLLLFHPLSMSFCHMHQSGTSVLPLKFSSVFHLRPLSIKEIFYYSLTYFYISSQIPFITICHQSSSTLYIQYSLTSGVPADGNVLAEWTKFLTWMQQIKDYGFKCQCWSQYQISGLICQGSLCLCWLQVQQD